MTIAIDTTNGKLKPRTFPVIATQHSVVMGDNITDYHLGGYKSPLMVSHNHRLNRYTIKRFVNNPRVIDMPVFINGTIKINQ